MQIYTAQVTGSLQLPIFQIDPVITASGNIWFNAYGTGSIKYSVTSGSGVYTRTFLAS